MFEATRMLFIYVETPLHVGAGRGLGVVDLPIQRECTTNYPIIQGSSLKGRIRAEAEAKVKTGAGDLIPADIKAIFGPKLNENASDHAGALSIGDARILLFPVRSLAGVFAWVTSKHALARFLRDAKTVGITPNWAFSIEDVKEDEALVGNETELIAGNSIVLDEFSFKPVKNQKNVVKDLGKWIAEHALLKKNNNDSIDEYAYWRSVLPRKLCILSEDAFRDFVLYSTEIQTHIRLDPKKKTVQSSALWTSESLPVDTLLYAPLMATRSRAKGVDLDAEMVLKKIDDLGLTRSQLGGDETTGQGVVAFRLAGSNESVSKEG